MTKIIRRFLEDPPEKSSLVGHWAFSQGESERVNDLSGNGHDLYAHGRPTWTHTADQRRSITLDGYWQWLETTGPVLHTDASYSVAAWVSLSKLDLKPDAGAYTAISQRSGTHTPFYLGVRSNLELQDDGRTKPIIRWCFLVAAEDGSGTGYIRWQKAWSSRPVDHSRLGEWILLIGTSDAQRGKFEILIPGEGDRGVAYATPDWRFWQADQSFQIGRAQYLSQNVDYWPGSIAEVFAWKGIVTDEEIAEMYDRGPCAFASSGSNQ